MDNTTDRTNVLLDHFLTMPENWGQRYLVEIKESNSTTLEISVDAQS